MATESASVGQLKAALSRFIGMAKRGATVEITSHRRVVARITGVPPGLPDGLARMVLEGRVKLGNGERWVPRPAGSFDGNAPLVSDLVLEQRGPRV